jgi:RND family efflux transporter MFP subunit
MNAIPPRPSAVRIVSRYIVPIAIVGGAAALLVVTSGTALRGVPEMRVAPVASIAVDRARADARGDGLLAAGWIEPSPYETLVPALRAGAIEAVHVLEGDRVRKGDLLVMFRAEDERLALAEADAALAAADADVAAATAARDLARIESERALEPTRAVVEARTRVAESEAAVRVLAASIAEATALRDEAEDERARKSRLVATGGASEGEVARLAKRVESLEAKRLALAEEASARDASLESARQLLALAESDVLRRPALALRLDEAQAQLDAATARRAAAAALRDKAQLALERSELRAPIDGTVLVRRAVPGDFIEPADDAPIALYDPAKLQVRCDVPLKDAGKLAPGLAAEIRVDAAPNAVFRGTVLRIDPVADIQKNTVRCRIAIEAEGSAAPNPDAQPLAALRPEMLARVRILAGDAASSAWRGEGVAVPSTALRERAEDRAAVLVAMPDGDAARLERRAVVLGGERANGWIEVREGLAAGDRVALDPSAEEGARIRPKEELAPDPTDHAGPGEAGTAENETSETESDETQIAETESAETEGSGGATSDATSGDREGGAA